MDKSLGGEEEGKHIKKLATTEDEKRKHLNDKKKLS